MTSRISLRYRLAVGLFTSTLVLAGCANSSSDDGDKNKGGSSGDLSVADIYTTGVVDVPEAKGDPVKGGTITVADFGEPRSLDTTKTYANGATGGSAMAAIYDTLMRYDFESDTFEPQLAESLTADDDTTWTLKLRDGVKFSDGTPLDADAFLSNMEYYTANYGYQFQLLLANIAETKKTDDLTVVFTTRGKWAKFPNMLAQGPGMIMAPASYANPDKFKPVGAGPFTLDKYSPSEELVLKANKDYWNGAPNLDALRFIWLGSVDDSPKYDALTSGDADTAFIRDPLIVEKARNEGVGGMMFSYGLGTGLWINTREDRPGADLKVRQAIDMAIDPQIWSDRTLDGAGQPTNKIYPDTSMWTTDVVPPEPDPAKAKELLEEAKANGFDGEISYTYGADPKSQTQAVTIKAMLEGAGFKVKLEPLRSVADQVQKLYIDHDFDLAVSGSSLMEVDPYAGLSSILFSQSGANTSGFSSPEMDGLLDELKSADTPEEGKPTLTKIQELWDEEVPGVALSGNGTFTPWNDNVHGIVPTTEALLLYDKAWKD